MPEIKNLGTLAEFPVPYNTLVTVQCDVGFSLMGGDVITCIRDDNYQSIHGQLPSCKESKSRVFCREVANLKFKIYGESFHIYSEQAALVLIN